MQNTNHNAQQIAAAALAVLAVAAFALRFGFSIEVLQFAALAGILAYASYTDLQQRTIPNACIIAAVGVRLACLAALCLMGRIAADAIAYYAASGLGIGAALLVFALAFERITGREGMGGGDVKLYAVAGLYVGVEPALGVVLLSCAIALVVSIVASFRSSSGNALSRTLPFGPSISIALTAFLILG